MHSNNPFCSPIYFSFLFSFARSFYFVCGFGLYYNEGIYLTLAFDLILDPCLVGINSVGLPYSAKKKKTPWAQIGLTTSPGFMELNLEIPMYCFAKHLGHIIGLLGCLCGPNLNLLNILTLLASSAQFFMGYWLDLLESIVVHVSWILGWSNGTKISPSYPVDMISLFGQAAGPWLWAAFRGLWNCDLKSQFFLVGKYKLYNKT